MLPQGVEKVLRIDWSNKPGDYCVKVGEQPWARYQITIVYL